MAHRTIVVTSLLVCFCVQWSQADDTSRHASTSCIEPIEEQTSLLQTAVVTFHGSDPKGSVVAYATVARDYPKTFGEWNSEPNEELSSTPWAKTCAALFMVALAGIVAMTIAQVCAWWVSPTGTACVQMQVMGLFVFMGIFSGYHATLLPPTALPLAKYLGQGEQFSGVVVASTWLMGALGACFGRFAVAVGMSHQLQYLSCLSCLCLEVWCNLLCGFVAENRLTPPERHICFILLKAVDGFCKEAAFQILLPMCVSICPPSLRVRLQAAWTVAVMLGSGIAPLVVSAVTSTSENTSAERFGIAAPFYITSIFVMCYALTMAWVTPKSHEELGAVATETYWRTKVVGTLHAPTESRSTERQLWLRKVVFTFGVLYGMERLMISACLDSATSFVLEEHFAWLPSQASLSLGFVYLVGGGTIVLPFVVVQMVYSAVPNELHLMKTCSGIAVLASASLTFFLSKVDFAILIADCLLVSVCMLASGVAEGLALAAAIPGSAYFSVENAWFMRSMGGPITRFSAPLLVRFTTSYSITCYGIVQLCITICGYGFCCGLASYANNMLADDAHETSACKDETETHDLTT